MEDLPIRSSAYRYQKIVEDFTGFIVRWQPGGRRTFISKTYCQYFGVSETDAADTDFARLIHPEDRDLVATRLARLSPQQPVSTGQHRVIRADGTIRWTEWTDRAIFDAQGNLSEYQSIGYDIDERKWAEEKIRDAQRAAEQASRAKTQFLANMSHEIRTPLASIFGFSCLLLDSQLTGTQRTFAERIKENSEQLVRMLVEVLDIADHESKGSAVRIREADLRRLAQEVVAEHQPLALKKSLTLTFAEGPPLILRTDPELLRKFFAILIDNALKYTDHGRVDVALDFNDTFSEVTFQVSDTGIGISEEDQKFLFEPFFQVDMSTTRRHGGAGLSLCRARQIMDALDGQINVSSQKKCGSTFTAKFPASR